MKKIVSFLVVGSFLGLLSQCSSEDDPSTVSVEANFESLWSAGLESCGSCHDGVDESLNDLDPNVIDLSTKESFENLARLSHDNASEGCSYLNSNPENSAIAQSIISFDSAGPCGVESYNYHSEKGAIPAASNFASAFKTWLEQGAQF